MTPALNVAIVGSGPSGFYAAEALMEALPAVEVSMLDRLPVPFGLVRSGVAPDHPKLKQSAIVYDRIARSDKIHFFGNIHVGVDVTVEELCQTHHCVIFAYGAEGHKSLDIPGESLRGSHTAREFVGWYNGHQDHRHLQFDLSQEIVAIIGQGNVALDVARILAKPVDELRTTDISEHSLDVLAGSRVRDIHIFGRRGPSHAKFSPRELGEFADISGCSPIVDAADLPPVHDDVANNGDRDTQRKLDLFRQFSKSGHHANSRRCHFHFYHVPTAILGQERMAAIRFEKTSSDRDAVARNVDFPCGLLFRSVGYRGHAIAGVPFDEASGVLRHQAGRLVDREGRSLYGMYATGWIKRGATGIIGTNRADSLETVETLISDLPFIGAEGKAGSVGLRALLWARGKKTRRFSPVAADRQVRNCNRPSPRQATRKNDKPYGAFGCGGISLHAASVVAR